jgi:hypothetical protein
VPIKGLNQPQPKRPALSTTPASRHIRGCAPAASPASHDSRCRYFVADGRPPGPRTSTDTGWRHKRPRTDEIPSSSSPVAEDACPCEPALLSDAAAKRSPAPSMHLSSRDYGRPAAGRAIAIAWRGRSRAPCARCSSCLDAIAGVRVVRLLVALALIVHTGRPGGRRLRGERQPTHPVIRGLRFISDVLDGPAEASPPFLVDSATEPGAGDAQTPGATDSVNLAALGAVLRDHEHVVVANNLATEIDLDRSTVNRQ